MSGFDWANVLVILGSTRAGYGVMRRIAQEAHRGATGSCPSILLKEGVMKGFIQSRKVGEVVEVSFCNRVKPRNYIVAGAILTTVDGMQADIELYCATHMKADGTFQSIPMNGEGGTNVITEK